MSCFGETHRLCSQNTRQTTASCDTNVYLVDIKAAVAFTDSHTGVFSLALFFFLRQHKPLWNNKVLWGEATHTPPPRLHTSSMLPSGNHQSQWFIPVYIHIHGAEDSDLQGKNRKNAKYRVKGEGRAHTHMRARTHTLTIVRSFSVGVVETMKTLL